MDLRYVKKLVELLDSSSVDSIEIASDKGMKLRISKTPAQRAAVQVAAAIPPVMAHALRTSGEGVAMAAVPEPGVAPRPEAPRTPLLEVKSPMVGTFYARPAPDAKPFVATGARIDKGQTVCIIEAMKIMNEIESEFAGVVKEVCVQDSQPVEYGQVLFRIDPNG
ncbi:MAG: acetyl-CoA carboxylase biotin carboxyl carrier protein [Gemmatimonadetes bacterium]|nr:acetyl-CoA carboxylase biotin carboxyl carrier protein [Gemmatimonadota bacterium]